MQRPVSGKMRDTASQPERVKISKRVRMLRCSNGLLHRVFTNDSKREVPRQAGRTDIVMKSHDDSTHFGIKQTTSLVDTEYWWHGMYEQVRLYVRSYNACARVKALVVPGDVVLHPLPMIGMFYLWSVDQEGPFPQSEYGNYYIMVMIEHLSKWVEVVAIPTRSTVRQPGCSASTYCASTGH